MPLDHLQEALSCCRPLATCGVMPSFRELPSNRLRHHGLRTLYHQHTADFDWLHPAAACWLQGSNAFEQHKILRCYRIGGLAEHGSPSSEG